MHPTTLTSGWKLQRRTELTEALGRLDAGKPLLRPSLKVHLTTWKSCPCPVRCGMGDQQVRVLSSAMDKTSSSPAASTFR
jgi:hypothetical protein